MAIEFGVQHLSPGTRSMLLRFEKAVREDAVAGLPYRTPEYVNAKRGVIRRLRRLEGTLPIDGRGKPRAHVER